MKLCGRNLKSLDVSHSKVSAGGDLEVMRMGLGLKSLEVEDSLTKEEKEGFRSSQPQELRNSLNISLQEHAHHLTKLNISGLSIYPHFLLSFLKCLCNQDGEIGKTNLRTLEMSSMVERIGANAFKNGISSGTFCEISNILAAVVRRRFGEWRRDLLIKERDGRSSDDEFKSFLAFDKLDLSDNERMGESFLERSIEDKGILELNRDLKELIQLDEAIKSNYSEAEGDPESKTNPFNSTSFIELETKIDMITLTGKRTSDLSHFLQKVGWAVKNLDLSSVSFLSLKDSPGLEEFDPEIMDQIPTPFSEFHQNVSYVNLIDPYNYNYRFLDLSNVKKFDGGIFRQVIKRSGRIEAMNLSGTTIGREYLLK